MPEFLKQGQADGLVVLQSRWASVSGSWMQKGTMLAEWRGCQALNCHLLQYFPSYSEDLINHILPLNEPLLAVVEDKAA